MSPSVVSDVVVLSVVVSVTKAASAAGSAIESNETLSVVSLPVARTAHGQQQQHGRECTDAEETDSWRGASRVVLPSAVAATMTSPTLRSSMRETAPSAMVTSADEGKHGSLGSDSGGGGEAVADDGQWHVNL